MFVFYATVYLNFENISQYYQLKQDKEVMLIQTDMQKKEYIAIMDKINAIQIYRHDMRHHINAINTFLHDNNISEAQKYLNKLNDNLSKTIIEKYCDNYGVNVILSSYIKKAKDEQIDVISKVHISENIKIDNIELGIILSNAIENAINACKKIIAPKDRRITIVCKEHHNQLYIQISNPYVGEVLFEKDMPISNIEDHGLGTRSIVAIAEKYEGVCSFTAENEIFKATAILKY
jgi:two-component system sensor histidine kinase AgrC